MKVDMPLKERNQTMVNVLITSYALYAVFKVL